MGIMNRIPGYGTQHCDFDRCTLGYPDGGICTSGQRPPVPGDWNAFYSFVLWATSNFQQWIKTLQLSVGDTINTVILGYTDQLVQDFSHHSTPEPGISPLGEGLIIAAAVLGGISAAFGGFDLPEVAAVAGEIGGGIGAINGVVLSMAKSTPNIAVMKTSRSAFLKEKFVNIKDALCQQIANYGNAILAEPVNESSFEGSYSDSVTSGPYVLKGGDYAKQYHEADHKDFSADIKASLVSGAISWIWEKEQVYIVMDSQRINGKVPSDLVLEPDVKNRTCDSLGKCYWFIKNTAISTEWDAYDYVPGYDKLGHWDLDPLDVAQAALASQFAGGYLKNWTIAETLPFLSGTGGYSAKPAKPLMFNLPVCSLDSAYATDDWPKPPNGYSQGDFNDSAWLRYIISLVCFNQDFADPQTGKNTPFPYRNLATGVQQSAYADNWDYPQIDD
ncbi:hypothetical protein N7474_006960 [Penicillium riverlandense]|uniref:uncharacterized protein n=1 Tax=Penicillium riverlandense TaxID=1903569 RepID=UPI002549A59C|nr:uncharacterized protein N7474_006960 [Penicillium riverlandense]KAJ5815183.1 hypothetical protein N7474_006960 [Penicillium riverlandense]